jgi:hypothetical protein
MFCGGVLFQNGIRSVPLGTLTLPGNRFTPTEKIRHGKGVTDEEMEPEEQIELAIARIEPNGSADHVRRAGHRHNRF